MFEFGVMTVARNTKFFSSTKLPNLSGRHHLSRKFLIVE